MGLYLGQEFVKIGDKTNSFTMRLKSSVTPTPTPSTELKFGDRIDNKATVVGEFESSDLGSLYFAVLDAQYRGTQLFFLYGHNNEDSGLPSYETADDAKNAKESATYNTNYILQNWSDLDETKDAFAYCRNIEPLNLNNKTYNVQLPNAYELQQIHDNRIELDNYDITANENEDKKLSNWGFGNTWPEVWSSNSAFISGKYGCAWHLNDNAIFGGDVVWNKNYGDLSVAPIIEIPKSDLQ